MRRLLPTRLVSQLPGEVCGELERQSVELLVGRLRAGIPAYAAIATVLFLASDGAWSSWLFAATLVACVLRAVALVRASKRPPTTLAGTVSASFAVSAPLGVMAGFAAHAWLAHSPLGHLMVMVAGVLLIGGIFAVAPFLVLGLSMVVLAVSPIAVAGAIDGGEGWLIVALALATGAYTTVILRGLHRDFWTQRLDQALRQLVERREHLLASALENVELCVALTHASGRLVYANPALIELAGLDRDEVEDRHVLDLLFPEAEEVSDAILAAVLAGRSWNGEAAMLTMDGLRRIMSCRLAPVRDEAGAVIHYVWLARDVTESRELEAQLASADKLATLGTLAAAVAHEINNPLAFVTLNLEHLGDSLHDPEHREVLDEVLDGTERMRRIVRQLLDYARDPAGSSLERGDENASADVRSAFDTATRLVQHELKHVAVLEASPMATYEARLPAENLVQVLVNLLLNASHAVAGEEGRGWIGLTSRDEAGEVVIEVEDDGPGVPEDLHQRIFEPLFTTKGGLGGTGLGLTNCRRIVRAAGGRIQVARSRRGGARFTVRLPAGSLARPISGTVSRRAVASWIHELEHEDPTGRVLIVDDEAAVARAMKRALRRHEVTVAHSVADALAALEKEPFDLVLCDLMMPEATGADLHRALVAREDGSHRRFAIMTGGVFSARESAFLDEFEGPVLDKPVAVDALREFVEAFVRDGREAAASA